MRRVLGTLTLAFAVFSLAGTASLLAATGATPWKGRASGAVTAAVPVSGGVILTTHAEGQSTHLGRFTRVETSFLDGATGAIDGSMVITAADGDQLFVTIAGGFISPNDVTGTYDVTGGTGRFEGASGGATFALRTPDGATFTVDFNGWLSK
jgi:hypothetical protein